MEQREIDAILRNHELSYNERQRVINQLRQTIEDNELLPQNRDGRGVRPSVRKLERKTVKHVGSALRHSRAHPDAQIRQAAKELIRSIPHHSFTPLAARASTFAGKVQKSSRRLKERRRQESGRIIEFSQSIKLEEVRSLTLLQRIGNLLHLCVSNLSTARSYLDSVLNGSNEIWVLRDEENFLGLLQVSSERTRGGRRRRNRRITSTRERVIDECNGYDNEPLDLIQEVALKILRCLNVDHVEAESFSQVGAFPILLREDIYKPLPEPLYDGSEWYYVWRTFDQLLIASTTQEPSRKTQFDASNMKWSQFLLDSDNEWVDPSYNSHIYLGKLINLSIEVPGFHRVLCEVRGS